MKYISPLLYSILALPILAHATFSFETKETDVAVIDFLKDVEQIVPTTMKDGINKSIRVEFSALNIKGKTVWGLVIPTPLNKKKTDTIHLNSKLLNNIKNNEDYDFAKSTLLHELSHIYDLQKLTTGHEKELLDACGPHPEKYQGQCRKLKYKGYSNSDSPLFLSIANWKKKGLLRRYDQANKLQKRRVDLQEDQNPQEAFAVNMEHFLQEPDFKCRKPSMYSYLAKAINHAPFPEFNCETEYRLAPTITSDGNMQRQREIDPKRLYEVHYFFAGQGSNIMSRWGHAMLRLVMCAPHRTQVDEKCLQDRAYHQIISFRADITNFNIDYIKGLTGKYKSKMFVLPMSDVIKEYTVGELRDLFSIPLKMNGEQKERLVSQVLERYWGYESKYYFLSNNCADETLNLIKNVYIEELKMINLDVLTPLSLRKLFYRMGLAEPELFNDLNEAKRIGYYFESQRPKLERIFEEFNHAGIMQVKSKEIEKYLNESTLSERQVLADKTEDKDLIGKLVFIEDVILSRKQLELQKAVGKDLDNEDRMKEGQVLLPLFKKMGQLGQKKSGLNLTRGYGIPQKIDEIYEEVNFSEEDENELKEIQTQFMNELIKKYSEAQKEINDLTALKIKLLRKKVSK